ncbi:hypothetical protein EMIHUDRAFT_257169 [Emiliania huxleyi CCMP1516]|uniref:ubiquitinyl hydrolase 1 n=2 Tax=Emiliania huxleyi TaxID=2903 RepID=A0A0D3IM21_EMIH1|nr:hypothetical protein EMIHUDRAFT_257169 [Emiliania huxleyi CCMP1516]EOD12306.1 hypothetical protein EMIHUDRAFT_257169 [Emiliania huxleyi CCMP1516]|eukprot:XP_005764735.1 hypothetical protein EMIHUDRAFT_257169 [Emiliania huxleyi CCMP1516]
MARPARFGLATYRARTAPRQMAQFLTVRLRHPRGTSTIQLPSSHATFDLLLEAVAEQVGGCAAGIRLSTGYPPKVLRLGPSDLIAGHINDMDTAR